jgi:Glycosyl hydrolase family 3 N terminal domain
MSLMKSAILLLTAAAAFGQAPYLNPDLPAERRAADLVSRMTLDEKVLQMQNTAPAIPRLNIPAYDWWNEALHGVARAGQATVFPQAIALAATWDTDLMRRVADVISTEARAKYHEAIRNGEHGRYQGLAQHQHLSRSALGTRAGDLRRRPVPHRAHGGCVHPGDAGQRSALFQGHRDCQALRRA